MSGVWGAFISGLTQWPGKKVHHIHLPWTATAVVLLSAPVKDILREKTPGQNGQDTMTTTKRGSETALSLTARYLRAAGSVVTGATGRRVHSWTLRAGCCVMGWPPSGRGGHSLARCEAQQPGPQGDARWLKGYRSVMKRRKNKISGMNTPGNTHNNQRHPVNFLHPSLSHPQLKKVFVVPQC